jgi:hypothetical protein
MEMDKSILGFPCEYMVGSCGAFSILLKNAGAGETADKMMGELKKMKISVSDAPGMGDHSFFPSPGYGMVQLNTFKGPKYLIMTVSSCRFPRGSAESRHGKLTRSHVFRSESSVLLPGR